MDNSSASPLPPPHPPAAPHQPGMFQSAAVDLMLQRESRAEEEVAWKRDHGVGQVRRDLLHVRGFIYLYLKYADRKQRWDLDVLLVPLV